MDRPYYAFGFLLAGMAGAMFAVCGSSAPSHVRGRAGSSESQVSERDSSYCHHYETGCGLDHITGRIYPQPIVPLTNVQVIATDENVSATAQSADFLTPYDHLYDRVMNPSAKKSIVDWRVPLALDADLSREEEELLETLAFFQSLLSHRSGAARHPHYDAQAAAEYAAAELAAAAEEFAPASPSKPRFSALIYTLPQSRFVDRLQPIVVALQIRAERLLESSGLVDAALPANAELATNWQDYEEFFSNISPTSGYNADELTSELAPAGRAFIELGADALKNLALMADVASEELRRIVRPRVAELNTPKSPADATR